ncbi:MAG: SpoIIE family protein phosphatase, partial [Oscillospiraceae bacterium]
ISTELEKINCNATQVICFKDAFQRINIEIYLKRKNISDEDICKLCCDLFDKEFDLPSVCEIENSIKISLFEKAKYNIDYFCQQHNCNQNVVCGDSFTYFTDSKGDSYMVLSDGMGSGKRAAIDSVMTCSIIEKIIKSGFSIESAIKLINSSLLLKSTDESLATIDIVKFDLYSGKAEFLKAGAAASYVLTRGGGVKIEAKSLPIGILQDISFDKKIAKLQTDDIICIVSDGVCDNGDDWILPSLQKLSHLSSKEIASKMLFEAKHRLPEDFRADDMTFMVAKIS